jgi:2-keto-4-pentenoate hydratase/2-oxohepta-3-ene-1,7-dioic acid hydratase in catechol pathway
MTHWIRFRRDASIGFGTLEEGRIAVHEGEMFDRPRRTSERLSQDSVDILVPCEPTKMIGLWNNSRAAAAKQGWTEPREPLYFFKPPSCFLPSGGVIVPPSSHEGRVFYEGELGVVIGKRCKDVSEDEADDCIFGYTCVNDVTAAQLIAEDESFPQWCRAKGFDTFGPFGPVIATGIDSGALRVTTLLGGKVRQDYPVSDLFFSPRQLVQRISRDMTLHPGDVISCGTSTGVLPIKPGSTVEITIEGIGTLSNTVASRG